MLINAYCTHRSPPPLDFAHTVLGRRDHSDPALGLHLQGFAGFVMAQGARPVTAMRYAVLRHLQRVRHHLAIDLPDASLWAFVEWARAANAILFWPDGTVRAPGGGVLIDSVRGDAEPGAQVPYLSDAVQRKAASSMKLAALGVRVPGILPPVVSEIEVELRSGPEVASRCLALYACAVRAESLSVGDEIPTAELRRRMPLAFSAMSPAELAFMATDQPERKQVTDHVWRYEALGTFVWALALAEMLVPPTSICDVEALTRLILARNDADADAFIAGARLRPAGEILDALDVTYRCHWAATEARVNATAPPASLEPGVVLERYRAFNWLTRFEGAAWDDITTPT
jgi:hypothetical protein